MSIGKLVNRDNWRKYKYKGCLQYVCREFPRFVEEASEYNPRIMSATNPRTESLDHAYATDREMHFFIEVEYPNPGDRYVVDPITRPREFFHVGNLGSCKTQFKRLYQRAVDARQTIYWRVIKDGILHENDVDIDEILRPVKFPGPSDDEVREVTERNGLVSDINSSRVLSALDEQFRSGWEKEGYRPMYILSVLEKLLPPMLFRKLAQLHEMQNDVASLGSASTDGMYAVSHIVDLAYLASKICKARERVIDAGSGVGVLAIATSHLGDYPVVAVDRKGILIELGRNFARDRGFLGIDWVSKPFEEWDNVGEEDTIICYRPYDLDEKLVEITAERGNQLILFPTDFYKREEPVPGWNDTGKRMVHFKHRLQSAGRNAYLYLSGNPMFHVKNQGPRSLFAGQKSEEELRKLLKDLPNYTLLVTRQKLDLLDTDMGLDPSELILLEKPTSLK